MKKLLFIFNPYSGKAQIKNKLLEIVDIMVKAGYEVTIYPTQARADALNLVQKRAKKYDLVVCSGGDGTLDEAVSGMMLSEKKVPLGYIPAGSTNDFANSLKIPKDMVKAAKAAGYTSCGTVEFLVDKDKNFYFMEMNTRIQVEHPITEMRTGIDIVKEQIKIAAGEKLKIKQKDIEFRGSSIECRINAENPSKKFRPSPGTITGINFPGGNGVRVDTAIYAGYTVPANYDSMIAKIIVHGQTRGEAISKMKRALEELVVEGIDTNRDFLYSIITHPDFIRGNFDTSFIEKMMEEKS